MSTLVANAGKSMAHFGRADISTDRVLYSFVNKQPSGIKGMYGI